MQTLSQDDIGHLAHLARLDLTAEEAATYAGQLTQVVEYVEAIKEIPVDDAKLAPTPTAEAILASDTIRDAADPRTISRAELLAGAPLSNDGYFVVQSVLGGADEEASA
jgi:aspartyl-tRNA(Asn)/glutamyl-tRNA(Gln) amidotransferase subunit C